MDYTLLAQDNSFQSWSRLEPMDTDYTNMEKRILPSLRQVINVLMYTMRLQMRDNHLWLRDTIIMEIYAVTTR